jgi:hypothetical protein
MARDTLNNLAGGRLVEVGLGKKLPKSKLEGNKVK